MVGTYDRNAVTAILYLNTVSGGETEMYPEYRIHLGKRKGARFQKWLDVLLQVETGALAFRESACWFRPLKDCC